MGELNPETVAQLVGLGRKLAGPQYVEGGNVPFVLVPNDCSVKAVPELIFNDHAAFPERVKASVSVLDPQSFVEYFRLFSSPHSRVFASEPEIKVVAILDYHAPASGNADWCQHRVTLTLRQSEEWKRWLANNNRQLTQEAFAEFLEQNSIDIIKPAPAEMMEIAKDLQAKTEVEFAAGVRMQDGQVRFKYSEKTTSSVGAGQLQVPEQFVVQIPAFVGGVRVPMQALFRFRVKESKLTLWYTLIRPEEVLRTAFMEARDLIADTLDITILNGVPQG